MADLAATSKNLEGSLSTLLKMPLYIFNEAFSYWLRSLISDLKVGFIRAFPSFSCACDWDLEIST